VPARALAHTRTPQSGYGPVSWDAAPAGPHLRRLRAAAAPGRGPPAARARAASRPPPLPARRRAPALRCSRRRRRSPRPRQPGHGALFSRGGGQGHRPVAACPLPCNLRGHSGYWAGQACCRRRVSGPPPAARHPPRCAPGRARTTAASAAPRLAPRRSLRRRSASARASALRCAGPSRCCCSSAWPRKLACGDSAKASAADTAAPATPSPEPERAAGEAPRAQGRWRRYCGSALPR